MRVLTSRDGGKMVAKDAKKMRWVFRLLPRVDESLAPFGKVTYAECKERVRREYVDYRIRKEMKKIEKEYKERRRDEEQFIHEYVLKKPFEEGPWDVIESSSEEEEEEMPFLDDKDWELHISVDYTHFQSVDVRDFKAIMGHVQPRILRAAGIVPKWTRLS